MTSERREQLKELVYRNVTTQSGTPEMRIKHTNQIIKCSSGDRNAKAYVKSLIQKYLIEEGLKDKDEILELTEYIYANKWGLGHIEKYDTPDIDEIMVHGTKILIQRKGEIIKVPEQFENEEEVIAVMRRCLEFDESKDLSPKNAIVMAKRRDGSRITAVIPPVGKMPYLNIRKFDSFMPTTENMLKEGTLSEEEIAILSTLAKGRANIIVIGEMGSGKTTFMKWLLQFLPENIIVGTMETTFELHLEQLYPERNWVQLEEKADYPLGKLFATQLRQNVDVMLLGEVRSYEANELIKAMSRGHRGSIGTLHSTGAEQAINDLALMVLETGVSMNFQALKYSIANAVDIVVKFRKLPNKKRVCAGIYEVVTNDNEMNYKAVPLYEFVMDEENPKDEGTHKKRGTISNQLMKNLNEYGVKMSEIEKIFGKSTSK